MIAPWRRLNICLYRRGICSALLRDVLRFQITVCLASLATGLLLWTRSAWIFWIGFGGVLSVWNFFSLTKVVLQFMLGRHTLAMGITFFLRSQLRLVVTVVVMGMAMVWAEAPAWAVLAGFSTSLAGIVWSVLFLRAATAKGRG